MPKPSCIDTAPARLEDWVALFEHESLPILGETAAELDLLRAHEDDVDAHRLAGVVGEDPLMTIKLLARVAELRQGREGSDTETATAALVMMGIPPFFHRFQDQDTVEVWLADHPQALAGFRAVLHRARRAARFAIGFAVHRMDYDAAVIHEAALLHDFAELLLWVRAPALALQIQSLQERDASLRSHEAQRRVLNIELDALEHALMLKWHLPELVINLTDEHHQHPSAALRNVQLAIRLARHSARSWDNLAIPDDVNEISELLNLSVDATLQLVHDIDESH